MGLFSKLIARIVINGIALWVLAYYFPNFILSGGVESLIIGALVLAVINAFVRPILKIIAAPFMLLTFGLFNIVINIALLYIADQVLTQLTITGFTTLFWTSLIIALVNSF